MSHVRIKLNKRTYDVVCDEDKQHHIQELAAYVDERMQELPLNAIDHHHAMLLTTLLLADDLRKKKIHIADVDKSDKGHIDQLQNIHKSLNDLAEKIS